jgi:flagellar hook assembly protein FlgD
VAAPGTLSLRCFNVAGEVVAEKTWDATVGTRLCAWDGRNSSGQDCSSGVYQLHFRLDAGLESGDAWTRVAIVR